MLWQWAKSGYQVFILDLDGTLMQSAQIDDQCYWQAVFSCFEVADTIPDLRQFEHITDSGILSEWCAHRVGRPPSESEVEWIRKLFLQLLRNGAEEHPELFQPLPGVENWLQAVQDRENVFAGIATGGWGHSARFKMRYSGLDRFELPMASSDDAIARTEIMQIAARATLQSGSPEGAAFTYVGDGEWDLQASRLLGWRFIGIAQGDRARRLRQAGASTVQADFKIRGSARSKARESA